MKPIQILNKLGEWSELETNNYENFKHINDVWNYLEASNSEDDLNERISKVDPKKFGSIYYDLHKDGKGATVIIDYQGDNGDYYEKVDVYFNNELNESINKNAKSIKIGKYKMYLILSTYTYGNNLYVELITSDGEPYADVTVNIPDYLFEEDDEIIISGDLGSEITKILKDLGILTDTGKYAYSGYGKYNVMKFNYDKAKDYVKIDERK